MKILADSTLPHLVSLFKEPFELTLYQTQDTLLSALPTHDILLCRSTLPVTQALLSNTHIQCVASASSGVDHIDTAYLTNQGMTLFDAKGCNAEAVADYVMSTVAWLSQHRPVLGKHAGVIGLGEVGTRVASRLHSAGFHVLTYDPIKAALDRHFQSCALNNLTHCDILFIHANLHETAPFPSKNLLDAAFLAQLKPGTVLVNAARGGIIDEEALLKTQKSLIYCTDVYLNEPAINHRIIDFSTLCTPHIAGHTIEAKSHAVEHIAQALHAHYQLPMPAALNLPRPTPQPLQMNESAYNYALRLYNPFTETTQLKNASDKTAAFLALRRAHTVRHDFTAY